VYNFLKKNLISINWAFAVFVFTEQSNMINEKRKSEIGKSNDVE
jgi:hypothetical protein